MLPVLEESAISGSWRETGKEGRMETMESPVDIKKQIVVAVLVIVGAVGAAGAWAYFSRQESWMPRAENGETFIATINYVCDQGHAVGARFYEGPKASPPAEGEPPVQTGRVEISLDGGTAQNLLQTISADGQRYANSDESLVFWAKGDEGIFLRNSEADPTYKNCKIGTVLPPTQ